MNVYQMITERIISSLENNVVPWVKPWKTSFPANFVSKKEYKGINAWLLYGVGETNYWLTYKQANSLGGTIKKGEKGFPVVFWSMLKAKDKNNKEKTVPFLRYYTVFNLSQTEGIEIPKFEDKEALSLPSEIVANMPNKPKIEHLDHNRAYYSPAQDMVNMPEIARFKDAESYHAVLFHELIHSTGHKDRLNREGIQQVSFGSESYSKEELIAELGSAFLCAKTGIQKVLDNQTSYIKGWLKALKDDDKLIISAAGKAQKAAEYILNQVEVKETVEA